MAVYQYNAVNVDQRSVTGTITADTAATARRQLRERGLIVQQVGPTSDRASGPAAQADLLVALRRHFGRWLDWRQQNKLVDVVTELSTLLSVGMPLLDALDTTTRMGRGRLKTGLLELRDSVAAGTSLAEAMRQRPALFDDLTINLVDVGEQAGTLDRSLQRLADFKQRMAQLKGRIGTALIYPAIVLTLAVAVSIFLMTYVVPQLLGSLIQSEQQIPTVTVIVKAVSDFLVHQWGLLLGGVVGLVAAAGFALRFQRVRLLWHRGLLKLPVLGNLLRKQAISRMAVIMSTLLQSGVAFIEALRITRRTTQNLAIRQALAECEEAIQGGREIASALERTGVFPPTVLQVFAIGQQSGELETMLDRLAENYDRQVTTAAQRLTAVLEPALILVMVTVVGFIAFATVLPMLEAGNVLQ